MALSKDSDPFRTHGSLAGISLVLAACGGGGGGGSAVAGDALAPVASVEFPSPGSITDADAVNVRGSASDGSGVSSVAVNGTPAVSGDAFASWSATLTLQEGDNPLALDAVDRRGNRSGTINSGLIRRCRVFNQGGAPAYDAATNRLFVMDDARAALLAVDPVDGSATIVSDAQHGQGVALQFVDTLAIDAARDRALTYEVLLDALIAIDLDTGDRTVLSDDLHGAGPFFGSVQDLVVDEARDVAWVLDGSLDAVLRVDLDDGDRVIVSDNSHGTGPVIAGVLDLALDVPRDRVLVLQDRVDGQVLAVDLSNGNRTLLSGTGEGSGVPFSIPASIVADPALNSALVVEFDPPRVLAVDFANGDRSEISGPGRGFGLDIDGRRCELDVARNRMLVASFEQLGLIAVDLASGDRSLLGEPIEVGSGPRIDFGSDLDVDPDLGIAIVADSNVAVVLSIDLRTGDRHVVADALRGSGPTLQHPRSVATDGANGRVLVEDFILDALLAVDLATGDRTTISDRNRGTGPDLGLGAGVVLDAANGRVLWIGSTDAPHEDALLAIDLATGDRTVISSDVVGSGPRLSSVDGLALDVTRNRMLTVDDELIAIDLSTGERTEILDPTPDGDFLSGRDVTLDSSGERAFVLDFNFEDSELLAIDLETGERTLVSSRTAGRGPRLLHPLGLSTDRSTGTTFVSDASLHGVFEVDLRSGDSVIRSR